jgi:hypothetical protein
MRHSYLQSEMFVRGLWFVVLAGDAVPQELRSLSMLGSPAHAVSNFDHIFWESFS